MSSSSNQALQMINEVLEIASKNELLLLICSPDQELLDKSSTKKVDENFKSGFISWSVKDAGQYMQDRWKKGNRREGGTYDLTTVAVLDDRSVKDRTIGLGRWTNEKREPPPDVEPVEGPEEWQSVRIRFEDIPDSIGVAILKSFLMFGTEGMELVGEDGIYNVPRQ